MDLVKMKNGEGVDNSMRNVYLIYIIIFPVYTSSISIIKFWIWHYSSYKNSLDSWKAVIQS